MKRLVSLMIAGGLSALPHAAHAVTLTNPLGTTDVRQIIANVIQGALAISGSVALVVVLYGGFLWMTSGGKPERIDKGKKTLVWALLGVIIILSAFVITRTIFDAILTGSTS